MLSKNVRAMTCMNSATGDGKLLGAGWSVTTSYALLNISLKRFLI